LWEGVENIPDAANPQKAWESDERTGAASAEQVIRYQWGNEPNPAGETQVLNRLHFLLKHRGKLC